ncbi:MAG: hypothetical protein M1818_003023 [Claussenomyces sp. TS43310]|nr:MAG: hypothetical protein M1818_003023 [Claussenomyces sp. TS43310]
MSCLAIADNAYFAQHATFPGINGTLTAPETPWILYGGSLAGAQTAFSLVTYGDILYAGIASSGTIKAKLAYSEWYAPIQKFGPSDCIASINAIIDKMDYLVLTHNEAAIKELKIIFGLEALSDNRDFAQTIAFPLGGPMNYPTNTWQELNWAPGFGSDDFWHFCSNVSNIDSPEDITSADYTLAKYTNGEPWTNLGNYAHYVKQVVVPLCESGELDSSACFGTQNVTPQLETYEKYGGYNLKADRLALIDGNTDVWLDLCYHSNDAPPRFSSDLHPEYLIAPGGHHWDSYGILNVSAEPQFMQQAHLWEIRTVKKWLASSKSTFIAVRSTWN